MGSIRLGLMTAALCIMGTMAAPVRAESSLHTTSEHLVDLSRSHWGYVSVVKVMDEYPILSGFQDHTFRGDWPVTRYTLAAAVAKTFNHIKSEQHLNIQLSGNRKKDLGMLPEHWAYPYVRKLVQENGLLEKFYATGQFEGDRVVTRKELAYALSEFLQLMEKAKGSPLRPERREAQLAVDLQPRSPYHADIEKALNRYQFMNLYADHTFRAEQKVTRYALAAALASVFELFESPSSASTSS